MGEVERLKFRARVAGIIGAADLAELSKDQILEALGATQYTVDILINEAERRGLIEFHDGMPVIPGDVPEGIEPVETILTRGGIDG